MSVGKKHGYVCGQVKWVSLWAGKVCLWAGKEI